MVAVALATPPSASKNVLLRRRSTGTAPTRPGGRRDPKIAGTGSAGRELFSRREARIRDGGRPPGTIQTEATYAQETRVDVGGKPVRDGHCARPSADDSARNQQPARRVGHEIRHESFGAEVRHEGVRNE